MTAFIRLILFAWLFTVSNSDQANLATFTEAISGVARVTNGLFLADALTAKRVKEDLVARELLGLDPTTTVEQLDEYAKVGDELTNIATKLGNCGSFCGDKTKISVGLELLGKIVGSDLKDAPVLMNKKSYKDLLELKKKMADFYKRSEDIEAVLETLESFLTFGSSAKPNDEVHDLNKCLRNFIDTEKDLTNLTSTIAKVNTTEIKIKLKKVVDLEALFTELANKQSAIEQFHSELSKIVTKSSKVGDLLSTEKIQAIEKKLIFFSTRQLRASQKKTSSAFEDLDDLNKLISDDLKSKIVKNLLAKGNSMNDLLSRLKPLSQLSNTLKPVSDSFKTVPRNIPTSFIVHDLTTISKELKQFQIFGGVQNCVNGVNFTATIPFENWIKANSTIKDIDQKLGEFETASNKDVYAGFTETLNLKKLVDKYPFNMTEIKAFGKVNEVIQEITNFQKYFKDFPRKTKSWFKDFAIDEAITDTKEWSQSAAVVPTIACLMNDNLLDNVKKVINASIPQVSDVTKVVGAASSLKSSAALLKQFEVNKKSKRSILKRNANGNMDLATSQSFSIGVDVLRRLTKAYEKKEDVRKLMSNEDDITSQIANDPQAQSLKDKVWSDAQRTALKSLPGELEKFSKSIPAQVKTMKDVEKVFKDAQSYQLPEVDTLLLKSAFASFSTPADLQDTLDKVSTLDLDFASSQSQLKSSTSVSFMIKMYFEKTLRLTGTRNTERPPEHDPESDEKKKDSELWIPIGLAVGGSILFAFAALAAFAVYKIISNKRQKKKQASKSPVRSTESDEQVQAMTTNSGKKYVGTVPNKKSKLRPDTVCKEGKEDPLMQEVDAVDTIRDLDLEGADKDMVKSTRSIKDDAAHNAAIFHKETDMGVLHLRQGASFAELTASTAYSWAYLPKWRRRVCFDQSGFYYIPNNATFVPFNDNEPRPSSTKKSFDFEGRVTDRTLHSWFNTLMSREKGVVLPARDVKYLMRRGKKYFAAQPSCKKIQGFVCASGDIHGHFESLRAAFSVGGFGQTNYLFIGDVVDRGSESVRCVLVLVLYALLNDRVHYLRGNHETLAINREYGFKKECIKLYGETDGHEIWNLANDMFAELPLSAFVNERIVAMHGGVPEAVNKREDLLKLPKEKILHKSMFGVILDLLWSDPVDKELPDERAKSPHYEANSVRGKGHTFNRAAVHDKCKKLGVDLIIRGHQVVEDGAKFFANRKMLTLFTSFDQQHGLSRSSVALISPDCTVKIVGLCPEGNVDQTIASDTVADDSEKVPKAPSSSITPPVKENAPPEAPDGQNQVEKGGTAKEKKGKTAKKSAKKRKRASAPRKQKGGSSKKIPKEPKKVTSDAPKEAQGANLDAPKDPKSGSSEVPKNPISGSSEVPKDPKDVSTDNIPRDPKSGSSEAPKDPKSGSSEAPRDPNIGSSEAPKEPTGGSTENAPNIGISDNLRPPSLIKPLP